MRYIRSENSGYMLPPLYDAYAAVAVERYHWLTYMNLHNVCVCVMVFVKLVLYPSYYNRRS